MLKVIPNANPSIPPISINEFISPYSQWGWLAGVLPSLRESGGADGTPLFAGACEGNILCDNRKGPIARQYLPGSSSKREKYMPIVPRLPESLSNLPGNWFDERHSALYDAVKQWPVIEPVLSRTEQPDECERYI
jgi:hypothetical protein